MVINIKNFLLSRNKKSKIGDFQDLDHVDGVAISVISANLYKESRDDVVLFYFTYKLRYRFYNFLRWKFFSYRTSTPK